MMQEYDTWHPAGCLIEKFGHRTIYDAGHNVGPKLSSIIKNGEWYWKGARSNNLVEIQCGLLAISLGNVDTPIWKSSNGKFSCSETWNDLMLRLFRRKMTSEKRFRRFTVFGRGENNGQ
jgi:hypothetical protein